MRERNNSSGIELFVLVVIIMVILAYCNSQHGVNIVSHVYTLGVVCPA